MRSPFFILGTQRSGTTLLHSILNSHPDLFVINEFWDLYPHVTGEIDDPVALEKTLIRRLHLPSTYKRVDDADLASPFDHVDLAFKTKLEAVGKTRWGIKHPRLTYYMEKFLNRYPEAHFVFLLRDPRGVVQSYLTRKMNVANVLHGALLWEEQVQMHRRFIAEHPERTLLIRFEDLLEDPATTVRLLCEFLGEEYSPDLLEYHKAKTDVWIHDGNVNITKPIQKQVGEKWRTRLTARQIGIIEFYAGDVMTEVGYSPVGPGIRLGWLERRLYDLHQKVMTTYWWQRRSGWSGARRRLGLPANSPNG